MAQISWSYDELVLAADLISRNDWSAVRQLDPRAVALSEMLRSGQLHRGAELPPNFRSPASIQRKTYDLITAEATYSGQATRGSKLDIEVMDEFRSNSAAMQEMAKAIRAALRAGEHYPAVETQVPASFEEGGLIEYLARRRERNPRLREEKLRQVERLGHTAACEVCDFDFAEVYGSRGVGYIEVHHVTPLYVSGKTNTSLEDLVLLCSNCHRMCHRSPWMKPPELKELVRNRKVLGCM